MPSKRLVGTVPQMRALARVINQRVDGGPYPRAGVNAATGLPVTTPQGSPGWTMQHVLVEIDSQDATRASVVVDAKMEALQVRAFPDPQGGGPVTVDFTAARLDTPAADEITDAYGNKVSRWQPG